MKKALKIGIIAVIAILIAAAIIYRMPQNISKEMTVCSLGGVTKTVKMELTIQKNLLRPTELKGNIYVDGEEFYGIYGYKDNDGKWKKIDGSGTDFFTGIYEKYVLGYDNSVNAGFWLAEDLENGKTTGLNGDILLYSEDKTFDEVAVWIFIPEEYPDYIGYYGPATTAEEAEDLMNDIYNVAEET